MVTILFLLIVGLHVWHNYKIRKERLEKHDYRDIEKGPEILKYLAASAIVGVVSLLLFHSSWYFILLVALLTRCAFFDVGFNLATKRSWNYENPKGKSKWDKWELKTGIPFELRFSLYVLFYLLTVIYLR